MILHPPQCLRQPHPTVPPRRLGGEKRRKRILHRRLTHPDPPVVHLHDPTGRNVKRYLRYVIRNDCLGAMFNQPMLLALVTVPRRLARYVGMCRLGKVRDPWGLFWIVGQLLGHLPTVVRERRPVKWSTLRRWRELRRTSPAYPFAGSALTQISPADVQAPKVTAR